MTYGISLISNLRPQNLETTASLDLQIFMPNLLDDVSSYLVGFLHFLALSSRFTFKVRRFWWGQPIDLTIPHRRHTWQCPSCRKPCCWKPKRRDLGETWRNGIPMMLSCRGSALARDDWRTLIWWYHGIIIVAGGFKMIQVFFVCSDMFWLNFAASWFEVAATLQAFGSCLQRGWVPVEMTTEAGAFFKAEICLRLLWTEATVEQLLDHTRRQLIRHDFQALRIPSDPFGQTLVAWCSGQRRNFLGNSASVLLAFWCCN